MASVSFQPSINLEMTAENNRSSGSYSSSSSSSSSYNSSSSSSSPSSSSPSSSSPSSSSPRTISSRSSDSSLLTTAVSCIPCGHIVSEREAINSYGPMKADFCLIQGKSCMICNVTVTAYAVNKLVRALAMKQLSSQRIISSESDVKSKTEHAKDLAYPGKSAHFMPIKGNWCSLDFHNESEVEWEIKFKSTATDSLIRAFSLNALFKGTLVLIIKCPENHEELLKYLSSFSITPTELKFDKENLVFSSISNIKIMFTILCNNNKIHPEYLDHLRKIIERGNS